MRRVCCVCHMTLGEVPGGEPGDVTHGYCQPCKAWNATAWQLMMVGKMTNEEFHAGVEKRREEKK